MPTGQQYGSNAPQTALVGGINNSQLTGTVLSFTGYPATPFTGVIDIGTPSQEIVDVITVSGNSITNMNRGVDGSSAQAHSNNATFTHVSIGRDFREARAHIDANASNDSTGRSVHGLAVGSGVVGTTDIQTLTNKTLTSPVITGMNTANPNITGTVTGAAQYQNITVGTTGTAVKNLVLSALFNQTADLLLAQDSVNTALFRIRANGATGAGAVAVTPTDTGTTSLLVNAPSGTTSSVFDAQINGVSAVHIDQNGTLFLTPGPLSVAGITGAATVSRYVGSHSSGAPTAGTFVAGDWVLDPVFSVIWVCTVGGTPGTWTPMGTVTLAETILVGTTASVTFSSIPAMTRVLLFWRGRSSAAVGSDLLMQIDGNTGNNYQWAKIESTSGTATGSHSGAATSSVRIGVVDGTTASYFGSGHQTLDGWANSTGFLTNTGPYGGFGTATLDQSGTASGIFGVVGPHNAIKVFPSANSFAAGSQLTLLGIA